MENLTSSIPNTNLTLYAYTMGLQINSTLSYDIGINPVDTIEELLDCTSKFVDNEERGPTLGKIQHYHQKILQKGAKWSNFHVESMSEKQGLPNY